MNPLNANCIIDWEDFQLVNNSQSKFVNAIYRQIKRDKVKAKKKEIGKPK